MSFLFVCFLHTFNEQLTSEFLVPIIYPTPDNHPRLVTYCEVMKESFWSDWNERLKTTSPPIPPSTRTRKSSLPMTSTAAAPELSSPNGSQNNNNKNGPASASNLGFIKRNNSNHNLNRNSGIYLS